MINLETVLFAIDIIVSQSMKLHAQNAMFITLQS